MSCREKTGRTTYPLEHLLPPDVLQPPIQVLDPLDDILNLALVCTLDLGRLSNCQIERESYATEGCETREPAVVDGYRGGREADLVVARVGGAECEAAGRGALLVDDAMVVVEDFLARGLVLIILQNE
jgi:hypothetical protein